MTDIDNAVSEEQQTVEQIVEHFRAHRPPAPAMQTMLLLNIAQSLERICGVVEQLNVSSKGDLYVLDTSE